MADIYPTRPKRKRRGIPHNFRDLTGQKFGRWLVLGFHSREPRLLWLCRCECGTERAIQTSGLRGSKTQSCGCLRVEVCRRKATTHGYTGTRIHSVWRSMFNRCYYERAQNYERYGGRGIAVCDRWNVFENFLADMGEPPSLDAQIDRIDTNGSYSPENCRWVTCKENNRNRRSTHWLTFNGETLSLAEWAERLGIKSATLQRRVAQGWSVELALSLPVDTRKGNRRKRE